MEQQRLWMAILRAAAGGVWLFQAYPQFTSPGSYLSRGFEAAVRSMAAGCPWPLYRQFLDNIVLAHASVFAYLTLVGNTLVGVSLLLGLLTTYGGIAALFLNLNYAIASGWMDRGNYALNGLLFAVEIVVIALAAGRLAGVDAIFSSAPSSRRRRY